MIVKSEISFNGLQFNCRSCGDKTKETIILLHGFPQSSIMWEELMLAMANEGYYSIAPDLRGYGAGARPRGRRQYQMDKLTGDFIGLIDAIGIRKVHLVGHDWGAAIGWKVVHDYPDRIISWTAMSVPHIQAFYQSILLDSDQKKKSQYVLLFQWPFLPEMKLKSQNYKLIRWILKDCTENQINEYISIIKQKGALTAMLNYYRANHQLLKRALSKPVLGEIEVPTLFIWGKRDIAIGPQAVERGHRYTKGRYSFVELDAGHFLIETEFDEVKTLIFDHLSNNRIGRA